MTDRARLTQAEIARAIRAAKAEGCPAVEVRRGGVTIHLAKTDATPLQCPEHGADEGQCDDIFGTAGSSR